MDTILGIDLGTTNSVVSILRDGKPVVLEEDGRQTLPSVVGLDTNGTLLVGQSALNQYALAPDRTVRSIKRKIGASESVSLGGQSYSPQEISAMVLRTLKQRAEAQLGGEVEKAVITVPAFFNEQQREATREAGELAGLDVVRIINEPTAAALVYNPNPDEMERLLVYDLGGGTFDVSIVQIEQGVIEVLASHGDTQLGGDDFDQLLLGFVCDRFQKEHDLDLRDSPTAKSRVLRAVEEAKKELSFDPFATVQEEFIAEKDGASFHLNTEISRLDYEALIESLISKTLVSVDEALSDAKLTAKQVDRVVLVGGASRTPLVHRMLQEQLGQPIHLEVDPDLCVSMGAAIQGGLVAGLDLGHVLVDITPHTLGIRCFDSYERSDHHFAPIIPRNTALPASRSEVFSTVWDGQEQVQIDVYQGESDDVRHNKHIGGFLLEGLADAKQGNEILVRFRLDLDGILTVSAVEKMTGLDKELAFENALSRFRDEERDSAKEKIEAVFAGVDPQLLEADPPKPVPVAKEKSVFDGLSPELREGIQRANDILDRAEALIQKANQQDAEEIQEMADRLREAIDRHALSDIEDGVAKLDDLVFYVQDVS